MTSTIAAGGVSVDGATLWHGNAPRLRGEGELALLQSDEVVYRGQVVAVVVADSLEQAREAAGAVRVDLRGGAARRAAVAPTTRASTSPIASTRTTRPTPSDGDFGAAFAAAPVTVDRTYTTAATHNNPMEPHAALAVWEGDRLTLYETTQAPARVRDSVAQAFGLEPSAVRIVSPHVGGGFGSKLLARAPAILAAMAARVTGRPVKLALTRRQMFALAGYRTPTIQRLRLGAERDGTLTAIAHEVWEQSSRLVEFAEQTALATRMMYAAPNRRTRHRLARLDVPSPTWMRAPGEAPGMFALECAIDELALELGVDPIELRIRNEPELDPETGLPFSTRNLVACLREGAERFGWGDGPLRRRRLDLSGAAPLLAGARRARSATARFRGRDRRRRHRHRRPYRAHPGRRRRARGRRRARARRGRRHGVPGRAGGRRLDGHDVWGSAVVKACRALREQGGGEARADTSYDVERDARLAKHAFGAQFAEVAVDRDTGEVRVVRLLGVFAVGRMINPKLARSQLIGGMTMGLSMALHEESVIDARFGDYVNADLAGYHIAVNADVREIEAVWLDEDDPHASPMGAKGIGEIGIVGRRRRSPTPSSARPASASATSRSRPRS